MQYVLIVIFASLLVTAQSCWKLAVDGHKELFTLKGLSAGKVVGFILTPLTIAGIVLYLVATALYMYLLSKYQFSVVQGIVIPLALVMSVTVGTVFFGDHLSFINLAGIAVVIMGILLITH